MPITKPKGRLIMGIIFFILFTLAEIALVVLTFTKFREKASWRKNRAIIRAAEVVLLLGMVLVPTTNLKWRFFGALIVLAVRLLIAGIVWLVMRKKSNGLRKKPVTVISCVLSVVLIAFSLVPAFIFTNYNGLPTTGEYKVSETSAILVDKNRVDEVSETSAILVDKNRVDEFENDGSNREVPAHFYYPKNADGEYPLVIFSHGAFGYYQSNFSTYAELASNGYIVVALDHPHHSFFTKDTDGKMITVDEKFIYEVTRDDDAVMMTDSQAWLKVRVDDENFVLDTIKEAKNSGTLSTAWHTSDADTVLSVINRIDTDKIGLTGHSLGGASAVALGRERTDIDAVIDIDGTMMGEITGVMNGEYTYNSESYPVPVLALFTENNYNMIESDESGFYHVNENMINNAKVGRIVTFENAEHMDFTDLPLFEHMDFTDLPLFSPFLGNMLGSGERDNEEMMNTLNSVVLNWFDYYLKGNGALNIQPQY